MRISVFFYISLCVAVLVRINDKNFKDVVINSGKYTLVDFYADWCRHCMNLMPSIEQLSEEYSHTPDVQIVKINGDEDGRKMTAKYDIPGFPTLLLFHGDDKPIEYDGRRDAESISNFIQKASGISPLSENDAQKLQHVQEIEEIEEVPDVLSSQVISLSDYNFKELVLHSDYKTLVLFSAEGNKLCDQLHEVWNNLTNIYHQDDNKIRFGRVDIDPKNKPQVKHLISLFGITHAPMILLFDPFRIDPDGLKRPLYYSGELTVRAFSDHVNRFANVRRDQEGNLLKTAGRIGFIEALLAKKDADIVSAISEIEQQLEESGFDALVQKRILLPQDDISMIPYYKKAIGNFVQGGKTSLEREGGRLKRILANGRANIDAKSFDYMQKRNNIIDAVLHWAK